MSDPPAPARGRVWRAVPAAIGAVAVVVGVVVVYRDRHDLAAAVRRLGAASLSLSVLCALVGVFVTVLVWRGVLDGLGASTDLPGSCRIYFTSQLGKYLPGSVWPVIAQMEFGARRGISRRTMLVANVLSLVIGLAVGLIVATVLLPASSPGVVRSYWWAFIFLPVLIACMHPRVIPRLLDAALRLLRRERLGGEVAVPPRTLVRAAAWSSVSWVFLGLHVFVIAGALGATAGDLWVVVGGMALAATAGIIVVPAPAGAGVRDAILVLTLTPALGATNALATSLTSRVLLVAVDVLLAAGSSVLRRPSG